MFTVLLALVASSPAAPVVPASPTGPVRLSHLPAQTRTDIALRPPQDSEGIAVASRLVAPAPMDIQRISYRLVGGHADCDAGMAHTAMVWKESNGDPQPVQGFDVREVPDSAQRVVTLTFPQPIHLERGQALVMGVELLRDGDLAMCMAASSQAPSRPVGQFLSLELGPAYQWQSFSTVGLAMTLDMVAAGVYSPLR